MFIFVQSVFLKLAKPVKEGKTRIAAGAETVPTRLSRETGQPACTHCGKLFSPHQLISARGFL